MNTFELIGVMRNMYHHLEIIKGYKLPVSSRFGYVIEVLCKLKLLDHEKI